jgi:hypothetical protein
MANTRPTKISFLSAVRLCFLAVFVPQHFLAEENADNEKLKAIPPSEPEERVHKLRRALLRAFQLVSLSGAIGIAIGQLTYRTCGPASSNTIASLQVVGALILLWGTLAVRGWDIQTYGGITLTERVNQWIYRFLYCCGTAALVLSLSWPST